MAPDSGEEDRLQPMHIATVVAILANMEVESIYDSLYRDADLFGELHQKLYLLAVAAYTSFMEGDELYTKAAFAEVYKAFVNYSMFLASLLEGPSEKADLFKHLRLEIENEPN